MKKIALAMFALFAIAFPVFAQGSLLDRAARLEQQTKFILDNMASKADVKAIKDDLAVIKAALQKAPSGIIAANVDPFAPGSKSICPGCACGCATTGVCTCANMQAKAPVKTATAPRYKTVCNGNSCSKVLMTQAECDAQDFAWSESESASVGCADCGAASSESSGARVGPIRRLLKRIFGR